MHIVTVHGRKSDILACTQICREICKRACRSELGRWGGCIEAGQITGAEKNNSERLMETVRMKCSASCLAEAAATVAGSTVHLDGSRHE